MTLAASYCTRLHGAAGGRLSDTWHTSRKYTTTAPSYYGALLRLDLNENAQNTRTKPLCVYMCVCVWEGGGVENTTESNLIGHEMCLNINSKGTHY